MFEASFIAGTRYVRPITSCGFIAASIQPIAPPRIEADPNYRPQTFARTTTASASIAAPEKGGGPKLSDLFFGTLEVRGR
jgi:hypothetical protein